MAAADSRITTQVRRNFDTVLGNPGVTKTNALIDRLRFRVDLRDKYYTGVASQLTALPITFRPDPTDPSKEIGTIGRDTLTQIGGGAYGTIFKNNRTNTVYKRIVKNSTIVDDEDIEAFHKELFMEPFIQTLLQNDTRYGRNIANISRMYRDTGVIQGSTRPRSSVSESGKFFPVPVHRSNYTYYYEMEPITYTLMSYIANNNPPDFILKLSELGATLDYFQQEYGFYHCDLHTENVMFTGAGQIKIIDFGMSCITDSGVVYSVKDRVCQSWDLLIYVLHLISKNYIPLYNPIFNRLCSSGANNLFRILSKSQHTPTDGIGPRPHWAAYNYCMTDTTSVWYIETVDGMPLIAFFKNYLSTNFQPVIFSNYMADVKHEMDSGGSGMGVNTPEEEMLAVGAPQQMTMGVQPRVTRQGASTASSTTCCSEGCCGLCCLGRGGKRQTKHTRKRRGKTAKTRRRR